MNQTTPPLVSIIIINWNSAAYLKKCLEVLYSNQEKVPFEVIVIDNASYDGSREMVSEEFSDVRFFQLDKNLGFAGANNFGSRQAKGQVLLFLNPDTEPSAGTIEILAEMVLKNNNAGAAGCVLLNSDKTLQLSSLMPFPSFLSEILDNEFLITTFNWIPLWGVRPLFSKRPITSAAVSAISGACLAVKKDVFENVNGFSEDYFMYSEDIDLCYKIKKSGGTNLFTNRCTVIHHGGGSSRNHPVSAFSITMSLESKKKYFELNHSALYSYLYTFITLLTAILRIIAITVSAPILVQSKKKISIMYKKWTTILEWSIMSIIGKPINLNTN